MLQTFGQLIDNYPGGIENFVDARYWRTFLELGRDGKTLRPTLANAVVAMTYHNEWIGMGLKFNPYLVARHKWGHHRPSYWTAGDDRRATRWLKRHGIHVPVEVAAKAVREVARVNSFFDWYLEQQEAA